MKKIHGICVPGVGDHHPVRASLQRAALKSWERHGLVVEYHPFEWNIGLYDQKNHVLNQHIRELSDTHGDIFLLGISAGKAAVINAFANNTDRVRCVASVNGLTMDQHLLHPKYFNQYPTYEEALKRLRGNLDQLGHTRREQILSYDSWHDGVTNGTTYINGGQEKTNLIPGHAAGIAWALTLGNQPIIDFVQEAF